MRILFEPVTTTCGHSFCKPCLLKAVDYKQECPTCRQPCSALLSVNVLLSNIVKERFPEVCFPNTSLVYSNQLHTIRLEEERVAHDSRPEDHLVSSTQFTLPVIIEEGDIAKRIIPGVPTIFQLSATSANAVNFASRTGSNKVALLSSEDTREGYLVEIMPTNVPDTTGFIATIRCVDRLLLLTPIEMNMDQGYFVGRFSTFKDDGSDKERMCDLLIQIRSELDNQFALVGQSGKLRLLSSLESVPAFQSTERQFLTSPDLSHVRSLLSSSYSYFERLSFLLVSFVFISTDSRIVQSIVLGKNTIRRLEVIRAALSGKQTPVLLLDPYERANLALRSQSNSESLLRGNSPFSAILLLLIALVVLFLKGNGYLGNR